MHVCVHVQCIQLTRGGCQCTDEMKRGLVGQQDIGEVIRIRVIKEGSKMNSKESKEEREGRGERGEEREREREREGEGEREYDNYHTYMYTFNVRVHQT